MSKEQILKVEELLRSSPDMTGMSIDEMRASFDQLGQVTPADNDVMLDEITANGVPCLFVKSDGIAADKTILFLHSGGYVMGTHRAYVGTVSRLGKVARAQVLFPEYRLAPEYPYPAAVDDVFATYRWLLESGHVPSSIAIAGDSAGGALVVATLLRIREHGLLMPSSAVLFSPFADLTGSGKSVQEKASVDLMISADLISSITPCYLSDTDPRSPEVSPVFAQLHNFPPLLLHVGTSEVLLDDTLRLVRLAAIADVAVTMKAWPNVQHLWQLYAAILEEGQQSLFEAGEFIKSHFQ